MNKTLKILGGLLLGQILLAGLFFINRGAMGAFETNETLLNLRTDDFDRVVISESQKDSLTLAKQEGRWVLPTKDNGTVSTEKLAQTLDKLLAIKKSWPVADSSSARKRLKVSEETFEKKIVFWKGDKEKKTLYLGSSPEYKKVHLRSADSNKITLEEFASYELSVNPSEWEVKKTTETPSTPPALKK